MCQADLGVEQTSRSVAVWGTFGVLASGFSLWAIVEALDGAGPGGRDMGAVINGVQLYTTDNMYDGRGFRPVYGAGDMLWRVQFPAADAGSDPGSRPA